MKSSIISLVFVAGLVAAQADKIPSCAAREDVTSCITQYTTGDGIAGCGQLDIKCICSNSDFLDGIACCLDDACDDSGKAAAVRYAQQICSSSGVTVPDKVVCKDSASSKSASASASAIASSKSASESAAASGASSSVSAATTTVEAAGSGTSSATETVATATVSTDAAAGLSSVGGLLGAVMAMLLAL
ncbi:hypothetical protein QQZ08_009432 [Neonectria magnoliae]|uniref:CFEM domain-containing protein n=1 Tax=Neonectria magnoliae TaxID=2732573 RepID=A0ABR1HPZ8_9HYPO